MPIINVLYIEDNNVDEMLFNRFSKQIESVNSLVNIQSFEKLNAPSFLNQFDLIFTDNYLGVEDLSKNIDKVSQLPFVVLSGNKKIDKKVSEESNFVYHIVKPVSTIALNRAVAIYIVLFKSNLQEILECVDLNNIFKVSGGDKNFEKTMIHILKNELPKDITDLKKHLSEETFDENLANILHKLKSKLNILNCEDIYLIVDAMEHSIVSNEELKNMSRLLNILIQVLQKIDSFIEDL